jgi:hypothetical protein
MSSANVKSVEAIRDFRIAMTNFSDDARNALSAVEMEIRRTRDWLQRDQLSYWQTQIKRRNQEVSEARTELHRRRLSQANSDAISDTEQKENLRIAQRRLEEAEDKVQRIKRWIPVFEHAIAEYHSASQPLGDRLTGALLKSLLVLDRMVASLEQYLATAPPETPEIPIPGTATGPAATVSTAPERSEADPAPARVTTPAPASAVETAETPAERDRPDD